MPLDEAYVRANTEANEIFERMRQLVERHVDQGASEINVVEVARESGLELDGRVLSELQVPEVIVVNRFLPWHLWFCWRPIWCWWWNYRYPYYRCCPYWWQRCHWYAE